MKEKSKEEKVWEEAGKNARRPLPLLRVVIIVALLFVLSGCATVYVTHGEDGGSASTTVVGGDVNQVSPTPSETFEEAVDAALLEVFLNAIAVLGLGVVLWYFFYPHGGEKWTA